MGVKSASKEMSCLQLTPISNTHFNSHHSVSRYAFVSLCSVRKSSGGVSPELLMFVCDTSPT